MARQRPDSDNPEPAGPRSNKGGGKASPSKKPKSAAEKKAAFKKYLQSLDPDKRKKVIAALAKKKKEKQARQTESSPEQAQKTNKAAPAEAKDTPEANKPGQTAAKSPPPSTQTKPRGARRPSTRILSKSLYRRAGAIMMKRRLVQFAALMAFLGIGGWWIAMFAIDQRDANIVINASSAAMKALEDDRLGEAQQQLNLAFDTFMRYQENLSAWRRRDDAQLAPAILRVAQGYRALGLTSKGLETLRRFALYLPDGMDSWQGRLFRDECSQFIDPEVWPPDEDQYLYNLLVLEDASTWSEGDELLVELTEAVGVRLDPLWRRYRETDAAFFGAPRAIIDTQGEFALDAEIVYKIDREPGLIYITPAARFTDAERKRLDWYLNSGRRCLIFSQQNNNELKLTSIEDIVLARPKLVQAFNEAVLFSE